MSHLITYHRPESVEEVLELLTRTRIRTAILAGGTYLNAHLDEDVEEVVDLQAVGLDRLAVAGERLTLGAMVRLQTLVEAGQAPELVRELARRAGPNTLRNAGTVGGVVAGGDWESELLAALLVFEAEVTVRSAAGTETVTLADFLTDIPAALQNGLMTAVSLATTSGQTASDRVARTPADRPIVAAVARRDEAGRVHLALCGVARTPVLVEPTQVDTLNPPGDFRGSSEYRREMAATLAGRVMNLLNNQC